MFLSLLASLAGSLTSGSGTVHTPHAECSGVAIGIRSDGAREVVLASRNETNILHSFDEGLTWGVVTGAGIEQSFPTRISWYPDGGQSRFLISTDRGIFRYDAEVQLITPYSIGIPELEADLVDLETARGGQRAPAITCNDMGAVFVLDPVTQTWSKVLDTGEADRNAVVAIVSNFDRNAPAGPARAMAAGINGRLYLSEDGGQNWTMHGSFSTPAADKDDWHITAVAFADNYSVSGELMVGRGRETAGWFTGDLGEVWRSADHGQSFSPVSIQGQALLYSSVQELVPSGLGPNGDSYWYLSFHFFPEIAFATDVLGVLRSEDGGATFDELGTKQDFLQEFSPNERTAVGREYRGMMTIVPDPLFELNGEVWMARSEGVYFSKNEGVQWGRRQLRPSKQVRGVGVGYDASGDLFAYAATYGSANVKVNVTDSFAEWLPGSGMAFQLPAAVSPRSFRDGVMISGGQVDVVARLEAPAPPKLQGFISVNNLYSNSQGGTGYVRTLELSPNFSAVDAVGTNKVVIWSARLKSSSLGETRISTDGLKTLHRANSVINLPGQIAPWMKSLSISPTFDEQTLPSTLDVFGCAYLYEQVWHLRNSGSAAAPVFEWDLIDWVPGARVQAVHVDPRFSRPNGALLWVMTTEGLYSLRDLSTDWSSYELTEYPKFDNLPLALELPPDMAARPVVYVMTWGGGLLKLDLQATTPAWEPVGVNFPAEWGNCFAFTPDFEKNRVIVTGGQNGLFVGRDSPGFAWRRLPMDYATDNQNPGIAYFDPNDGANPDPQRRWGWDLLRNNELPPGTPIEFFGGSATWTDSDGAYLEYPRVGASFAIRAAGGPGMGAITIQMIDYLTGAVVKTLQHDLQRAGYQIVEVPVFVTQVQDMFIRVTVDLDPGEAFYFDGFRFQE
jgi:hypothetical protein